MKAQIDRLAQEKAFSGALALVKNGRVIVKCSHYLAFLTLSNCDPDTGRKRVNLKH